MKQGVFVVSAIAFAVSQAVYGADEPVVLVEQPVQQAASVPEAAAGGAVVKKVAAKAIEGEELGDVVVSASKIQQSIKEAPANVTVISSKRIENSSAGRIGDLLNMQAPSLMIRGGATSGLSRQGSTVTNSMRGLSLDRMKMFVDGQNMGEPNSGNINVGGVTLDEIERIEVVPGISSALYGSGALGGVINVITKVPTKESLTVRMSQEFGAGERKSSGLRYTNKWSNGVALELGGQHEDYKGWADSYLVGTQGGAAAAGTPVATGGIQTISAGTPSAANNWNPPYNSNKVIVGDLGKIPSRADNARIKLYYDLGANSKVYIGHSYLSQYTGYDAPNNYLSVNGMPQSAPLAANTTYSINGQRVTLTPTSFNNTNPSRRSEQRSFVGYEGEIVDGYKLKVDVGQIDRDYYYVGTSRPTGFVGTAANYYGGQGSKTSVPTYAMNATAQLSFALGDSHYIVTGLGHDRGELHRKNYGLSSWRNPETVNMLYDTSDGVSMTNALFLQDQFAATDGLTLYMGGRYDDWKTHGNMNVLKSVNGTIVGMTSSAEHGRSAFSPKIAAVYKVTDGLSLKTSWGRAFKAPTNFDMYSASTISGNKIIQSNPNLRPETADSIDVGLDWTFDNGMVVRAAAYETSLADTIGALETPGAVAAFPAVTINSQKSNVGKAKIRGYEFSTEVPLSSWLKASAGYSTIDARYTSDLTNTGLVGKQLTYVPQNMANVAFDMNMGPINARLSSRYTGKVFTNAQNADYLDGYYTGYSRYWLTDLKVGYNLDKTMKLNFSVNNLQDTVYYEYYRMPGRSYVVELVAGY
jgi:iron complex outermembrane receptor protein